MRKGFFFWQVALMAATIVSTVPERVLAQEATPHDSSFYVTYSNQLMLRVYMSQKHSSFKIPAKDDDNDVEYRANSKRNFGIGATYNNLTLNISYGFGSSDNDKKGKTTGLDFQFHLTPYKWAIDALASFHKGNYLHPRGAGLLNTNSYYQRPDVIMNLIGIAAYRVPNAERFSYRAALVQNEWQIKSAGSLLFGGEVHYGVVKGDSALVPTRLGDNFLQSGIDKVNFVSIGPGIGYAYTLVIAKHFFITGSLIGNLDVNFSSEKRGSAQEKNTAVCPSAIYKAAAGYNSHTWSISGNLLGNVLQVKGAASSDNYRYNTGKYRVMIAKKIGSKR